MNKAESTNSPMNILYVFGGEKAQGAEIVIERLMYHNSQQVNAHLLIAPGKFANDLRDSNKPYFIQTLDYLKKLNRSSSKKLAFYMKAMRNYFAVSYHAYNYIRKHKINMICANTMVAASYLIPLIVFSKIFMPSVKWLWNDHDIKYYNKLDITISKMCARLYNRTLVVSNEVKHKYIGNNKVTVLYNGLDTNVFKPDRMLRKSFLNKLKLDESQIIIGIAAVISPIKGQLNLIKVFNNLQKSHKNIKLIIAGDFANDTPAYSKQVMDAVAANDDISYLGFINNMPDFYNACDIVVNNTNNIHSEPLGTAIYEAMACEKLVLASRTGGTPEIITDEVDGFIFEADNVDDLQQKVNYAIVNFSELNHVKEAAREKVKQKFNITKMVNNYNEIVQSTLLAS